MPRGLGRPFNKRMRNLSKERASLEKDFGKAEPLAKEIRQTLIKRSDQDFEARKYGSVSDKLKSLTYPGRKFDAEGEETYAGPKFRKGGMVRSNRDYGK